MTIRLDCFDIFYERLTYTDTNRHVRLSISVVKTIVHFPKSKYSLFSTEKQNHNSTIVKKLQIFFYYVRNRALRSVSKYNFNRFLFVFHFYCTENQEILHTVNIFSIGV